MTVTDRPAAEAEVLIAEARGRARRRRRWLAALAVLAVLGGAAGYWGASRGGSGPTVPKATPTPPVAHHEVRPVVDPAALSGHGTVAFVSRGALWLTGAAVGGLRELLPASQRPSKPAFSADGRWLVAITGENGQWLWLARADGQDLHRLPWRFASVDGWSPHGHTLAVEVPSGRDANTLTLITPGKGQRAIARVHGDYGAVWSPGGHSLAVAAINQPTGRTTIRTYPASGRQPTTWFSVNNRRGRLGGIDELRLQPAGWWAGQGIGFWAYGDGMVSATDQAPLYLLQRPGSAPVLLGNTLTGGTATAVTGSRAGDLAIVAETRRQGLGRLIWQYKKVEVCPRQAANCTAIASPSRSVTLDPTWSPDGHTLAYIQAPQRNSPAFPQRIVHRWYAAHRLVLYNARTGARHVVPHSAGATAPQWSASGHDLLYEANDGLWIRHRGATSPQRVATPLYPPGGWPSYYGQIDWIGQYAWSRRG